MSELLSAAPTRATKVESDAQSSEDAFIRCLDRVEALIERESAALRACASIDFDDLNQKKTHLLLEFMRLSRTMPGRSSDSVRRHLEHVNVKLADNARLLDLHLSAMLEISRILILSIQSEESDGTYSCRPPLIRER